MSVHKHGTPKDRMEGPGPLPLENDPSSRAASFCNTVEQNKHSDTLGPK